MAFEKLGIGGVLTFDDTQAVAAMSRTSVKMSILQKSARDLKEGMQRLSTGLTTFGVVGAIAGGGLALGTKAAVDFEHQMSAVGAVTGASNKEMKKHIEFARRMAIQTKFTAKEIGKAQEVVGKFGIKKEALRKVTKGVIDLAAAEGIAIDAAARVAVGSLKGYGLKVKEMPRVVNILAQASKDSGASAITLGEAFTYTGGLARRLGMNFELTTAVLGRLHDANIKGGRAGRGLSEMFKRLFAPTKKSKEIMNALGISVGRFGKNFKRLPEIIQHISKRINKLPGDLAKSNAMIEIFGSQGIRAFSALALQGKKSLDKLYVALKKSSAGYKLNGKEMGAAAFMAAKRMDNVKGATELFKSSMESFFISIMRGFLDPLKARLKDVTGSLNNVLFVMMDLEKDPSLKNQQKMIKKYGKTTLSVALGVRDALDMVKSAWRFVGEQIKKVASIFGDTIGGDSLRHIIKFALGIVMIVATIAPLMGALFVLKLLMGALWNVGVGALLAIKAAALPLLIVFGAVAAALLILRKDGESLGQTAMRLLSGIYNFAKTILTTAIIPLFQGIYRVIKAFTVEIAGFWESVAGRLRTVIYTLIGVFKSIVKSLITILKPVFEVIAAVAVKLRAPFKALVSFMVTVWEVIAKVAKALGGLFKSVAKWIAMVIRYVKPIIVDIVSFFSTVIGAIYRVLSKLFSALGSIFSAVINIVRKVADFLRPIVGLVLKLVGVIWKLGKTILKWVLKPFMAVYNVIKAIAGWVWGKLKGGFEAVAGAVGWILKVIKAIGGILYKAVMWPLKKIASGIAWILDKAASVMKYIMPAGELAGKGLRLFAQRLRVFAGTAIAAKRGVIGAVPFAKREPITTATPGAVKAGELLAARRLAAQRAAARAMEPKISIVDKRKLDINARTSIDGRCVAAASSRHKVELSERAGYGTTPWQRRAVVARAGSTTPPRAK